MDKAAGRVLLPPSVEPKKYVIDLVPNLEVWWVGGGYVGGLSPSYAS